MIGFIVGFVLGCFFGLALGACFAIRSDSMEKREEESKWINRSSEK